MMNSPPPARKIEVSGTISEKREYHGLCSSCSNTVTCTYPRDPGRSVVQCDEFEGSLKSPFKTTGTPFFMADLPSPSQRISHFRGKTQNGNKGLCRLCEARSTCSYPKPEGGVWHCEEYR